MGRGDNAASQRSCANEMETEQVNWMQPARLGIQVMLCPTAASLRVRSEWLIKFDGEAFCAWIQAVQNNKMAERKLSSVCSCLLSRETRQPQLDRTFPAQPTWIAR